MMPDHFVNELCSLVFENTFNPYSSRCAIYDLANAPAIRSQALLAILEKAAKMEIDSMWIARDLGYRGGRRTGLALTDDVNIHAHAERWGVPIKRPTKGDAVAERTAAIVWNVLSKIEAPVFLWNVFPLHPHELGTPFSNRSHNSHERRVGKEILYELIHFLKPRRLIAIGNDAAQTACHLVGKRHVVQVRHPSYGGQRQFFAQMRELYASSYRLFVEHKKSKN